MRSTRPAKGAKASPLPARPEMLPDGGAEDPDDDLADFDGLVARPVPFVKNERPVAGASIPSNPRDPPSRDEIAWQRRWLIKHAGNGQPVPGSEAHDDSTTALIYRYTRGQWIAAGELGYGERVTEKFVPPGASAPVKRHSQRTTSGRQRLLRDGELPRFSSAPPAPAPAPTPSDRRPADRKRTRSQPARDPRDRAR